MKTSTYLVVTAVAAGLAAMPVRAAGNAGQVFLESPDHPQTWAAGASNVHQALRWDAQKGMLFADVKYSTRDWADDTNPTRESDYSLAFPNVRFDASSGRLISNGTTIGTVRHGMFGSEVVLNRGVQLSIHRHDGKINAMIMPLYNE
jgi:hypothetical protein